LEQYLSLKKLKKLHLAYSQQYERLYVQHLIKRDGEHIAKTLEENGYIMICGSLAMYNDLMDILNTICLQYNKKPVITYKKQIKSDCY
ncbi:MAG TPA: hypothetical protein VNJ50_03400, partial [Gelidibacter sp.]|nr:hypothetical protein [Gelidibacter sp.]